MMDGFLFVGDFGSVWVVLEQNLIQSKWYKIWFSQARDKFHFDRFFMHFLWSLKTCFNSIFNGLDTEKWSETYLRKKKNWDNITNLIRQGGGRYMFFHVQKVDSKTTHCTFIVYLQTRRKKQNQTKKCFVQQIA